MHRAPSFWFPPLAVFVVGEPCPLKSKSMVAIADVLRADVTVSLVLLHERKNFLPYLQQLTLALDAQVILIDSSVAPAGSLQFSVGGRSAPELAAQILDLILSRSRQLPLHGLVLTGGRSTRMGQDKALLSWHGTSQAVHAFQLLGPLCDRVYLSTREHQWYNAPELDRLPQITDRFVGFGPLGGILSALTVAPEAAWLVVACDLPLLDTATLAHLVHERDPLALATCFNDKAGMPEPLCTIFEPKAALRLHQFLGIGLECPRKVLLSSTIKALVLHNSNALHNVNCIQDANTIGLSPSAPTPPGVNQPLG